MRLKPPILILFFLCAALFSGCTGELPEQKSGTESGSVVRTVTDSQKLDVFAAAERDLGEQLAAYEAEMKRRYSRMDHLSRGSGPESFRPECQASAFR